MTLVISSDIFFFVHLFTPHFSSFCSSVSMCCVCLLGFSLKSGMEKVLGDLEGSLKGKSGRIEVARDHLEPLATRVGRNFKKSLKFPFDFV